MAVYEDDGTASGEKDANDSLLAEYQYDGRHRRIAKLLPDGENWDRTDYYYSVAWQCLEERTGTVADKTTPATDVVVQYVWDLRYIDALVCRDRDQDADGDCTETDWNTGNDTDEHLYYCNDANMNVTALLDTGGDAVERYSCDPYGKATFLAGDTLFAAGWLDAVGVKPPGGETVPGATKRPAELWVVSPEDGRQVAAYDLDAPPVFDGLIAAGGRLYLAGLDGTVRCLGEAKKE